MKRLLIAAMVLCAACEAAPAQPVSTLAAGSVPLSVQSTLIVAQATQVAGQVAQATEARRLTEQAIADGQTATAFPVAMAQTQAAATATALPAQVTQTAIVSDASIRLSQTAVARIEAANTRTARYQAEQTQAAVDADLQAWRQNGSRFAAAAETGAVGALWVFVVVVLGAAMSVALMFTRWMWRPRVIGDRLMLPTATGWRDLTPRQQLPAPAVSETRDLTAEASYDAAWRRALVDAGTVAGLVGGWTKAAMVQQFPPDARPMSEDDWERIVEVLAEAGVLVLGRGNKPTDYGAGQNFATLHQAASQAPMPPYSPAGPGAPKVLISAAHHTTPHRTTPKGATL